MELPLTFVSKRFSLQSWVGNKKVKEGIELTVYLRFRLVMLFFQKKLENGVNIVGCKVKFCIPCTRKKSKLQVEFLVLGLGSKILLRSEEFTDFVKKIFE